MGATTCNDVIETLRSGELAEWRGWPLGCGLSDLEAAIDLESGVTNTVSGKERLPTSHRAAAVDGLGEPLYVWFRGASLVKASLQYPTIKDVAALLAALGEPPLKLDTYFSSVPTVNRGGEWVYPTRGLTLFMSSDKSNVVAVSLFPPTTEERYRAELYNFEPPREHP